MGSGFVYFSNEKIGFISTSKPRHLDSHNRNILVYLICLFVGGRGVFYPNTVSKQIKLFSFLLGPLMNDKLL